MPSAFSSGKWEVKLADARRFSQKADAVRAVEKDLGEIADLDTGVAIDLMLSYRGLRLGRHGEADPAIFRH